jgi:hypothetical protein
MDEVFPILGGVVLGLAMYRLRPLWIRVVVIAIVGVGLGAAASWVSGELVLSYMYLLVDAVQVMIASVITGAVVSLWLRRRSRSLAR